MPKEGGKRRRVMFGYEKGLIWGNDNYRTNGALVNIALATGNVGQMGGGVVRLGGHQEGYVRPDYPGPRPAPYVDKLLIEGQGRRSSHLGLRPLQDHAQRRQVQAGLQEADRHGEGRDVRGSLRRPQGHGRRHPRRDQAGRPVRGRRRHRADEDRPGLPRVAAGGDGRRNEPHLDERRAPPAADRTLHGPARSGDARLPHRGAARQQPRTRLPRDGQADVADKFKGFDWKTEEDAFMDGYHKHAKGGEFVTYERLRAMGTNGVQEPATGFEDGKLVGTQRLYADGVFSTEDGKARFMDAPWRGLEAPGKEEESKKFAFLINNGRANHVWQSAYLDQREDLVMDRWPYPFIQMNPDDMKDLGLSAGDLVEVYNDNGATQAMAYPTPTARRKQTFMLFAFPMGVQGNVVSPGVNELIIPNYKQTWGDIRKLASSPGAARETSFKSWEYKV